MTGKLLDGFPVLHRCLAVCPGTGKITFHSDTSEIQNHHFKGVAKLGANWNNGLKAGSFNWNVNNTPSNRNRNISRRLANVRNESEPERVSVSDKLNVKHLAPWQNITISFRNAGNHPEETIQGV